MNFKLTDIETWPSVIRWVVFIPAGLIVTSLAQGFFRLLNVGGAPFFSECLARLIEPYAFLGVSIAIIPKFEKGFALIFTMGYLAVEGVLIYLSLSQLDYPWKNVIYCTISTTSCLITFWWIIEDEF